jgi:phage repressor protein C with HTH and peptisase S24 domain
LQRSAFKKINGNSLRKEYNPTGSIFTAAHTRVQLMHPACTQGVQTNRSHLEEQEVEYKVMPRRVIRLYDIPAAAGFGSWLDSDSYDEIETDSAVPKDADYAVKVSGDSMTPRIVDGQIIFVKDQDTLDIGEIGIFGLNGDAYIKKLGRGELLSLNPVYSPIELHEYDSFHVFGKVVG